MRKILSLACVLALASGCIRIKAPDDEKIKPIPASSGPDPNEVARNTEAAKQRGARPSPAEVLEERAATKRAHEDRKQSALESSCAESRDARLADLAIVATWMAERRKALEWVDAHCHVVDDGKDVVREYQLPNGRIEKRRVTTGYPERKCDAKEPPGTPAYRSEWSGRPAVSYQFLRPNRECREADEASGRPQPCIEKSCE